MARASLGALQGFVLAARTGNLSRAAQRLHVTVSALSHQIRGLEERLGRRLFRRGPRGVELTEEGARLLDAVGPQVEAIERALLPYRAPREDALTLSLMPSIFSSWLLPRLPRFVARHPEIQLNLQSSAQLVDFEREAVDAAMRFGPGQWPGVLAEHLFDDWLTPIASPELIARLGRPPLAKLSAWPLLRDPGDLWPRWFERYGGAPPTRYIAHFDDTEALHAAAVQGMGIALGRVTMARPLIEAGRLVALTPRRMPARFAHYLAYPPRSRGRPAFEAFRAWLLDEARRYAADAPLARVPARRAPATKKRPAG